MGNQNSVLEDMVYRVFPNLEPSQHQPPDASPLPSFQNLWDGSLFSPRHPGGGVGSGGGAAFGRTGSIGGSFAYGQAFGGSLGASFANSFGASPSLATPTFARQVSLDGGGGRNERSERNDKAEKPSPSKAAAEAAALAAHRARTEPRPMGMAAFEIGSLALRVLDLWDRLGPESIRQLKRRFKEVSGPQSFIYGSPDMRWRIVGVEVRKELGLLTASIASIAERCTPELVDEIQMHCWNVSRKRRRNSLFEGDEEGMLMAALASMASVTGKLREEMETLDNLMPSSHPLRTPPDTQDADPFSVRGKGGSTPPTPAPSGNSDAAQAKRQQLVRAQLSIVQQLQWDSLWTQDFDWTVLLLCVALAVLWHKFREIFGRPKVEDSEVDKCLGTAGLSLHYANIVLMLDNLVQRPNLIANSGARNEVYNKLPASVKTGLRTRLRTGQMAFDPDIVLELRRTVTHMLSWMVPLAEATASWESERSYGCHMTRKPRHHLAETLYFADRDQFELLLIELLVTLTHTLGPRHRQGRIAALAQAELLGTAVGDEVRLPPAYQAALPKLERRNGGAHPGYGRSATHVPKRLGKKKSKKERREGKGEKGGEGERREGKGENGDEGKGKGRKEEEEDEEDDDEEGEEEEEEREGKKSPKSKPPSALGPTPRVRRPAPRPPPGFGKVVYDNRPQLMG